MKNIRIIIPLALVFASCSSHSSDIEFVEKYYQGLNEGDYKKVSSVISDQFTMRENESNYEVAFSPEEFHNWFQWDSVFNPVYTVSKIELKNDTVFATVSKKCDRIMLFNEAPITNLAYFEILNGKIMAINRYKYLDADWKKWTKNKEEFLQFVRTQIPEYNDMEKVQDLEYGQKFAKAIHIYTDYTENEISLNQSAALNIKSIHNGFDDSGTPFADYYLFYNNGSDSLLIDSDVGGKPVPKSDYKEFNIPENALSAIHSYWAGAGIVHYLVKTDATLVIYKCVYDEMEVAEAKEGESCFKYEKLKIYSY